MVGLAPVEVRDASYAPLRRPAQRAIDVAVGTVLLLAALPLLALLALAVAVTSPGPVLFRQRRYGQGMQPFTVLKLRTMCVDADPEAHRRYIARLAEGSEATRSELKKLVGDPRVTRVGRLLRRFSLDELPQILNVLAGQMSLVGPRPAIEYELEHYRPEHYVRFRVRPGITGLWQVSGRNRLGFHEMLDVDVRYVRDRGPLTDLRIVARTPLAMIRDTA